MSDKLCVSILPDDESVSMATENKTKDNESITTDSVATISTTEASKVSLRLLKSLIIYSDTIPYSRTLLVQIFIIILCVARKPTD